MWIRSNFVSEVFFFIIIKCSQVNIMTPESLDYALENKFTVLAVWNAVDCKKCASDMWDIYNLFYAFEDQEVAVLG